MSWTVSANLQAELERATCAPVIVVHVNVPALHWLTVLDWTAGSGDSLWIEDPSHIITEGVDFTAAASNAETARAIAIAWNNNQACLLGDQIRAHWRGGPHVAFTRMHLDDSMTFTTSDANAWTEVLPPNPTQYIYCSHVGRLPLAFEAEGEAIPVVASITGLEWSVDPVTREIGLPRVDLVFSGGTEIRELLNWHQLRRSSIDVYLGTDDLASFASYMQLPTLFVDDIVPGPGQITMKLVDALGDAWRDRKISGAWTGWHPLQVAENILEKALAQDGVHYDSSTLVPTTDPQRSHFCLSRFDDQLFTKENRAVESEKAGGLLTGVLALMSGTFRPGQDGVYSYVPWDYNASAVVSFESEAVTGNDVDEISQDSILGMMINSATIAFGIRDDNKKLEYTDTDSVSIFESHGIVSDFQVKTDWVNTVARLCIGLIEEPGDATTFTDIGERYDPDNPSTDDVNIRNLRYFIFGTNPNNSQTISFPIDYASRMGFCGTQYDAGSGTFASGMSLGSAVGRYVIIRVSGAPFQRIPDNANEPEYILLDQWIIWDTSLDYDNVQASPSGTSVLSQDSLVARVTDDPASTLLLNGITIGEFFGAGTEAGLRTGRGCGGTSAPGLWYSQSAYEVDFPTDEVSEAFEPRRESLQIVDFTIPWYMAKEIIRRFRYGAPKISFKTNLSHIAWEIGEFANVDGDDISSTYLRGTDGLDTNVVWEITGKKIDLFGDQPGIEWELTFVRDGALTEHELVAAFPVPPTTVPGTVTIGVVTDTPTNTFTLRHFVARTPRHLVRHGAGSKVFWPIQ